MAVLRTVAVQCGVLPVLASCTGPNYFLIDGFEDPMTLGPELEINDYFTCMFFHSRLHLTIYMLTYVYKSCVCVCGVTQVTLFALLL